MLKFKNVVVLGLGLVFSGLAQARVVDQESSLALRELISKLPESRKEITTVALPDPNNLIVKLDVAVKNITLSVGVAITHLSLSDNFLLDGNGLDESPDDLVRLAFEQNFVDVLAGYVYAGKVDIKCEIIENLTTAVRVKTSCEVEPASAVQ